MSPEPIHSACRLYRFSQQMTFAVVLTGLLIGAALVGFFVGVGSSESACFEGDLE